jgi:poly(3-hydroxybutyrate) depolymerase
MKNYMRLILAVAFQLILVSAGCGKNTTFAIDNTTMYHLTYNDSDFGPTDRRFWINIPKNYDPNLKNKLMFYFHGTGVSGYYDRFVKMGNRQNIITVFPQGMGDVEDGSQGWNVPYSKNDPRICKADTNGPCYDSCKKKGLCYTCSWTTCFNDVEFVDALMEHMKENLCLDMDEIYTSGGSNGAMFTYYLSSQRPHLFKGWQLFYG